MKKNFVVATPTQQEYDALMQWGVANKQGNLGTKFTNAYGSETAVSINGGIIYGYANLEHYKSRVAEYGPIVPFSTFAAIQGIELGPAPVEVQVGSYTAKVDYTAETVTVGCQTIPFTKVKEVYKLTQQHVEGPAVAEYLQQEALQDLVDKWGYSSFTARSLAQKLYSEGYKTVKVN